MVSRTDRISSSISEGVVERSSDLLLEDLAVTLSEPIHGCVHATLRRSKLGSEGRGRHHPVALGQDDLEAVEDFEAEKETLLNCHQRNG
jgi:hypothetical protein